MAEAFEYGLTTLYRDLHHEVIPNFDFHPGCEEDRNELFHGDVEHEFFLPASSIPTKVVNAQDPVHCLVERKRAWKERFRILQRVRKRQFGNDRVKMLKETLKSKKDEDVLVVPQNEIKFLELSRKDPDPLFFEDYNWYYTGGCLKTLLVDGLYLLLSTQGKGSDQLRVTCLEHTPSWRPVLPSATTLVPQKKQPILQVEGIAAQKKGFIAVRLKNKMVVYTVRRDKEGAPLVSKAREWASTKPLVGLDVTSQPKPRCCTIDTDCTVLLYDLATMVSPKVLSLKQRADTCGPRKQVQFLANSRSLLVSDSCCLQLWDTRQSKLSHSLVLGKRRDLLPCEDVSLVFPSRVTDNLLYVGTTHRLMSLDQRSSSWDTVSEWTHQMSSPPLYGHSLELSSGKEVLCVANQKPANVLLAVPSTHQLLKTMTVRDSLLQAQSRGECLDPFLNTRLSQSLAGITCLPSDQDTLGFSLLSLTAAGDLFHQRLQAGSAHCTGQGLKGVQPAPCKKLYFTDRHNMRTLHSGLKNKKLKLATEPGAEVRAPQPWQCSKTRLQEYSDILSPVLLDIWDLEEWVEEEEVEPVNQRVTSWLNKVSSPSCKDEDMFQSQE